MYKNNILKVVFSIGLLLGSVSVFSQELSFEKKSKEEILRFEKVNDGVLTDSIASFGILKNPQFDIFKLVQTKVWIFKRLKVDFNLQLYVW